MKKENIIFIISFVMFCVLTATGVYFHEPWYDEAQAWLLAQDLNFIELLKQMAVEGHLFLWFTVLMPFAKLNITYPYAMQITNLLFIWGFVYLFWKNTNIPTFLKLLITFSFPICFQYAILARCYSLGIFLLILLITLYKEKLKRPILYSFLIFLCANTTPVILPAATALGILLIFDYIKSTPKFFKKINFWTIIFIACSCIGIIIYQLHDTSEAISMLKDMHKHETSFDFLIKAFLSGLTSTKITSINLIHKIIFFLFLINSIFAFKNSKKTLFFFLFSNIGVFLLFVFAYNGYLWHWIIFYIYTFMTLCFFNIDSNQEKNFFYKLYVILLVLISMYNCYIMGKNMIEDINTPYSSSKNLAIEMTKNDTIKKNLIINCHAWGSTVLPYLRNKNLYVHNCFTNKKSSFSDIKKEDGGLSVCHISKNFLEQTQKKELFLIMPNWEDFYDENYDIELYIETEAGPSDYNNLNLYKVKRKN